MQWVSIQFQLEMSKQRTLAKNHSCVIHVTNAFLSRVTFGSSNLANQLSPTHLNDYLLEEQNLFFCSVPTHG